MIEKFQDWMITKVGNDKAYYSTIALYLTIMFSTLILNGWIFNNWLMVIIGSLIINIIRNYSSGFHCHVLMKCIILTNILFIIFGYIAKQFTGNLWVVLFLLSLYSIKNIYMYAPIIKTDHINKTNLWHKKMAIAWICVFIISGIIFAELDYILIANNIFLSIIMVDVLLFKNEEGV